MSLHLYGFSGKMRSGKDTAADYMVQKLQEEGLTVNRMMFADTIKRIQAFAQQQAGFPMEHDRQFLQWIGTDWGRAKDPDVWVKALERQIMKTPAPIVVTDVRFPNEFVALRRLGFKLVRVMAPDDVRVARGADPTKMLHPSETSLDTELGFDHWVENDGSLEDLHAKVDAILKG